MKKYFTLFLLILCITTTTKVFASATDGTIDPLHNYAWSTYLGWFNFATPEGNIHVTDSALTGYIWTENYGWINLAPTNGGVTNDGEGHLSGFAWGQSLGWGNYTGVTIDAQGVFHGSVLNVNLNLPSLSFDCSNCSVITDWRPVSIRTGTPVTDVTGGGGNTVSTTPLPLIVAPIFPLEPVVSTTVTTTTVINPTFPTTGFPPKNTKKVISIKKEKINSVPILHFTIPALGIDTTIESVGLTSTGAMDSPVGPDTVGWFKFGTSPGEIGNAVIDGHSGWKNNRPAVFDTLYKIKKGDKIYTTDEKGILTTFIVRAFHSFDPNEDASSVFISTDGIAHLNLITCSGVWNPITKSHSTRLVVFTDKEIK